MTQPTHNDDNTGASDTATTMPASGDAADAIVDRADAVTKPDGSHDPRDDDRSVDTAGRTDH